MLEAVEPLYHTIADSIASAISEEWLTAKFECVFYSDSIDWFGEYTRKVDGISRSINGNTRNAERAIREIRKKFKEAGQPLWGQACFELTGDRKFKMKWGYNNCDENGNTHFKEDEFLKRNEERRKRLSSN